MTEGMWRVVPSEISVKVPLIMGSKEDRVGVEVGVEVERAVGMAQAVGVGVEWEVEAEVERVVDQEAVLGVVLILGQRLSPHLAQRAFRTGSK